jgi:hypothetical protein
VFRAKRADRVKLVYWDGTGVCLFAKRLEEGAFRWRACRTCDPIVGCGALTRIVNGHLNSQLDDLLPWAYPAAPALKNVA